MEDEKITKKEIEKKFSGLEKALNAITNLVSSKSVKNLIVQDANGAELDFSEVETGDDPAIGDKATIDNVAASGEYVMPDGSTYVFEAGVLTEIKPKVEDVVDAELTAENSALKEENETLKAQNLKLQKNAKKAEKQTKAFVSEMKNLKASMTSEFGYNPKIEKKNEKIEENTSRSLFKSK